MDMVVTMWLKTFRWKNLLITALLLLAFRLGINEAFGFPSALPNWGFVLAVLSTIMVMAAGYLMNDISDRTADEVNRPERSAIFKQYNEEQLFNVALYLAGGGILIGGVLAWYIDQWLYSAFPVISVLLLYQYAQRWKRQPFVGNAVVAFLAGLVIITLLAYDVLPALLENPVVQEQYGGIVYIYLVFAGFAFYTTLIRELIKDIEDIKGDRKAGYRTLPIVWSERAVRFIAFVLLLIFTIFFGRFTQMMFGEQNPSWPFIAGLFIFSLAALWLVRPGDRVVNYRLAQNVMKALMAYGILLLPAFSIIA